VVATAAIVAATLASSGDRVIRDDDFSGRYEWPEGRYTQPVEASAELIDGRYNLTVTNPGGIPASANVDTSRQDDVLLTAKATGTGAYGVWCRGTPAREPLAKYEFYATSKGEAGIVKRAANGQGTELWPFRAAFTPAAFNTVQARCQTEGNGARLSLTVNGSEIATVTDRSAPLGPGAVGVIAFARSVPQAAAEFDTFRIEAP
ncbi:hypothetical protein ACFQ07_15295, partial [Actinomadura adrarensis]